MAGMPDETRKLMETQSKMVYKAHKELPDRSANKKLIINVAPSGTASRDVHPYVAYTAKEVQREVRDAYNAGAAMWHLHPRIPDTGAVAQGEIRPKIHKEWCDAVFEVAPDIITNVGATYGRPTTTIPGTLVVDEQSILAENRVAPVVEPLMKLGPNNRYIEVCISLVRSFALGGTLILSFNPRAGVQSDVKYLQSQGIKVELSPFSIVDQQDAIDWVMDSGISKQPVIFDTLMGCHNSPSVKPAMEAMEYLFSTVRAMPKGVVWQALFGGRYWLPLATTAIMLGADVIRVGMEDSVYLYPHSTEPLKGNGPVIDAVAKIAKALGREIATPAEARDILGIPQLSK